MKKLFLSVLFSMVVLNCGLAHADTLAGIGIANDNFSIQKQDNYANYRIRVDVVPTPEAPTLLLFALGAGLVALLYGRKKLSIV